MNNITFKTLIKNLPWHLANDCLAMFPDALTPVSTVADYAELYESFSGDCFCQSYFYESMSEEEQAGLATENHNIECK